MEGYTPVYHRGKRGEGIEASIWAGQGRAGQGRAGQGRAGLTWRGTARSRWLLRRWDRACCIICTRGGGERGVRRGDGRRI